MLKRFVYLLLLNGLFVVSYGQNLVINPSFELRTGCPLGPSEMDKVSDWEDAYVNIAGNPGDTCSTSDYYHSCSPSFFFPMMGVPNNILGSEPARTGDAYCGIITFEAFPFPSIGSCSYLTTSGWREYLVGRLSSPLVAGNNYCVSFYVSLADDATWATGDFHVYLTPTWNTISCASVGSASHLSQFVTPQLRYDGAAITQTNGWTRLEWNYTATGGEQYIILGNFDNDANTNDVCANSTSSTFNIDPYAYYYIDDVSVVPGSCTLPMNLHFKAYKFANKNIITWKIENTEGIEKIRLYKSSDKKDWRQLSEFYGIKASEVFEDTRPYSTPRTYYKLEILTQDGTQTNYYAEVQNNEINFDFYPNPIQEHFTVTGDVKVRFYTLQGREIIVPLLSSGVLQKKYDFSALPTGNYLLEVVTSSGRSYHYHIVKE